MILTINVYNYTVKHVFRDMYYLITNELHIVVEYFSFMKCWIKNTESKKKKYKPRKREGST